MKSRYLAGTSLAVMGAGFLITLILPQNLGVRLLQGGFEAGLVGGFADWFAVTALFRHPMGIPIPHTSLLLKNRDKIVNSLISALETELLNKESITKRLRQMKLFQGLSTGLMKLLSRKKVRMRIVHTLSEGIRQIPLEKITPSVQQSLARFLRSQDLSPMLEAASRQAFRSQLDEKALNYVINFAGRWVSRPENEYMLGQLASSKLQEIQLSGMKGFALQAMVGFLSEEKLGSILKNLILSSLHELSYEDSTLRQRLLTEVRQQVSAFAENPEVAERLKMMIGEKLEDPGTEEWMLRKLEEFRARVLLMLEEEERSGGRNIIKLFRWVTNQLRGKEEMIDRWEQGILSLIVQGVEANYYRIGLLVRENLDQMDDEALVQMLEEKVGSDLQWIRVNGAICGFLIGLVLTVVHLLII
ncbi:DUF445 domain-containing protein [Paenibacillus donghaensis]|jgi:uncharacterized membrane-anchored protein YjiN (DUF445 family)|uniref:DUF445 domain-containing protein n=1 Tax=Paenibacillus donghaensis TaxID=414771 RepID=UPI0018848AA7|nr:DUF445 domain-containing protein [Paenibacillus donghaensis]MBE9913589.1 DUF445 domain-containing protein [Paenibacillus donghaensis]